MGFLIIIKKIKKLNKNPPNKPCCKISYVEFDELITFVMFLFKIIINIKCQT